MPRKNFKTMAKILKGALSSSIAKRGFSKTNQEKLKKMIPSLKELEAELREINKEFNKFRIDERNKYLIAETKKDAMPGGKNFGKFRIRLQFIPTHDLYRKPAPVWYVRHYIVGLRKQTLPPYEELQKLVGNKYYNDYEDGMHPHLSSGGHLCTGAKGSKAINHAAKALRIADIFFILNSVLNGYNAREAYNRISDWDTVYCEGSCRKKYRGIENMCVCVKCGRPICKDCVKATCDTKDCKSAICVRCMQYNKGKHRAKCKVHKKLIGKTKYLKPKMKKAAKEKQKKFDGIKGWTF